MKNFEQSNLPIVNIILLLINYSIDRYIRFAFARRSFFYFFIIVIIK